MKLKYLLPVATIASVATIVTPLVTSCGNKTQENSASWEKGKSYHALDPKAAASYKNETDLTAAYHDDLVNNKLIYADDIVNYFANLDDEDIDIRKVKYTVNSIGDLEDFSSEEKGFESTKAFRISIQIEIDATVKMSKPGSTDKWTFEFANSAATLNNIPVVLCFGTHGGVYINFYSDADCMDLANDNKWSINMPEIKFSEGEFSLGQNIDYNKNNMPSDIYILTAFSNITSEMVSVEESNYFKFVTKN